MSKPMKIKTSNWYRHLNKEIQETLQSFTNDGHSSVGVTHELQHNILPHLSESNNVNTLELSNQTILHNKNAEHLYFDLESENENDYICSTVSDPLPVLEEIDTISRLKHWAVDNQISQKSLEKLLEILIESGSSQFQSLPKDLRTFLQTPKYTKIRPVFSDKYCNIALKML